MSSIGIAIDVIQVANICDAVDVIYAVAERDMECFNPDAVAKLRNLTVEQEVIDVLSHVPQLRNPHNLATYATTLTQCDDGLGCGINILICNMTYLLIDITLKQAIFDGRVVATCSS